MDHPQEIKKINASDIDTLEWIGGFFDANGYCTYIKDKRFVGINNTNPIAASIIVNTLSKYDIPVQITERSKPSKSSKKKRWDVLISRNIPYTVSLLEKFTYAKKEALNFLKQNAYNVENAKILQCINSIRNKVVKNKELLLEELNVDYNLDVEKNPKIELTNFCNVNYLAGIIDAVGILEINQQNHKHVDEDSFTPIVEIKSFNKLIITNCYSTLKNINIGCHLFTQPENKSNYISWELKSSGIKRIHFFGYKLSDRLMIKKQCLELMTKYCEDKLRMSNRIDDIGYNVKSAIDALNKTF